MTVSYSMQRSVAAPSAAALTKRSEGLARHHIHGGQGGVMASGSTRRAMSFTSADAKHSCGHLYRHYNAANRKASVSSAAHCDRKWHAQHVSLVHLACATLEGGMQYKTKHKQALLRHQRGCAGLARHALDAAECEAALLDVRPPWTVWQGVLGQIIIRPQKCC